MTLLLDADRADYRGPVSRCISMVLIGPYEVLILGVQADASVISPAGQPRIVG